jgi:hypothetical protein
MLGFAGWKGVKLRWNCPWFFICKTRAVKWHPEEGRRRGLQAGRCRCWVFMQLNNFSKYASLCKAYGWLTEASWNEMLWFSFGLSVCYRIVNLRWPLAYFCLIWTYFISWHISTYFTSLQNFVGYDRYGKVYLKVLKSMIVKGEGYAKKEADQLSRLLFGVSCNLLWDVSSMQLRWHLRRFADINHWILIYCVLVVSRLSTQTKWTSSQWRRIFCCPFWIGILKGWLHLHPHPDVWARMDVLSQHALLSFTIGPNL